MARNTAVTAERDNWPVIPDHLTDDMKVAELVEALEALRFNDQQFRTICIDRGVRNFLVQTIKPPR